MYNCKLQSGRWSISTGIIGQLFFSTFIYYNLLGIGYNIIEDYFFILDI